MQGKLLFWLDELKQDTPHEPNTTLPCVQRNTPTSLVCMTRTLSHTPLLPPIPLLPLLCPTHTHQQTHTHTHTHTLMCSGLPGKGLKGFMCCDVLKLVLSVGSVCSLLSMDSYSSTTREPCVEMLKRIGGSKLNSSTVNCHRLFTTTKTVLRQDL